MSEHELTVIPRERFLEDDDAWLGEARTADFAVEDLDELVLDEEGER
jgi:hypothetical protein